LVVRITLVQTLVDRLTEILDQGDDPPDEACMVAKIAASDFLWKAADDLVEILGGRGYMENNIAPQILRDCRMLRIGEGANELMTLSVGRRVLYSERLHRFLQFHLRIPEMSACLKDAAERIQHRCLARSAPFADRSSAMAWAQSLTGQVAIRGVLLAAVQSEAQRAPRQSLRRAQEWAKLQFDTTLSRALEGFPIESFLIGASDASALVTGYSEAIGDVEQMPPGVDEIIDPLLVRDPSRARFPSFAHLPGNPHLDSSPVGHNSARQR
jgi:hypothetical protein